MDTKSNNKYRDIDSMYFEWEVELNDIKRVELAATPEGDGANGTSIFFAFKENYYQKYDIFKADNTFEQFIVISRPVRKADDYWVLECRLITSDINDSIDPNEYHMGDTTRFQSVAMPEEHENSCHYNVNYNEKIYLIAGRYFISNNQQPRLYFILLENLQ